MTVTLLCQWGGPHPFPLLSPVVFFRETLALPHVCYSNWSKTHFLEEACTENFPMSTNTLPRKDIKILQQHSIIETCWYLLQQSACRRTFECLQHTPTRVYTVANAVTCLTRSFSSNWWLDFRMNGALKMCTSARLLTHITTCSEESVVLTIFLTIASPKNMFSTGINKNQICLDTT